MQKKGTLAVFTNIFINVLKVLPVERIFLVQLRLVLLEVFEVFTEAGLDVFIVEKLTEDDKLLPEELVGEVDGGVDDAGAVGSDGVGDVSDADGVQMFAVARLLHKDLHNVNQR